MRARRVSRTAAVAVAVLAALATVAPPAGALINGDPEPVEPPDRPDLKVTALTVTPVGSDWSIGYTVANTGTLAAASSTVAFSGNGVAATRGVPSLAPSTSRAGSLLVPRSDCYVVLRATADSARVVTEASETNNARETIGVVPGCPPRYKISAVSFKALDESGIDASGSDEPYWIFNTVSNGGTASSRATQVFGGIDTGDTQQFGLADNCLWGCGRAGAPAPVGIGLSIQLWEKDLGHVDQTLYDTAKAFQTAGPILSAAGAPAWVSGTASAIGTAMDYILGWADDDLMGSSTYAFGVDSLANALPSRGTSFLDTRTYEGGGARYSLTLRVSRIV